MTTKQFNPPPGWPKPPPGWIPPADWKPDPGWPAIPEGWELWLPLSEVDGRGAVASPASLPPPVPVVPDGRTAAPVDAADDIARLRAELSDLRAQLSAQVSTGGVVDLDDERVLQEVGIYRYHHPLENSEEFRERLLALQEQVRQFVVTGSAILASDMFTFNNSLAKGRRMTSDFSKLMLRAYNAEADNCVRSLRAGNAETARRRLDASVASIAKLGSMMEMRVNPDYHALRIDEINLTGDFAMKVQEEREAAREERERLREERKVEMELAAEREHLAKERQHYENAMKALLAGGDEAEAADLAAKLEELDKAISQNDFRAANIRAGYVYVISNVGALGRNMVKIGMTRRLEPLDRIRELGDASVPFPFDVHAIYFSDDAVKLEGELHDAFAEARVNRVNERREFFFATPVEVRDVLAAKVGNLLEFTELAESTQYLQSRGAWPAKFRT